MGNTNWGSSASHSHVAENPSRRICEFGQGWLAQLAYRNRPIPVHATCPGRSMYFMKYWPSQPGMCRTVLLSSTDGTSLPELP